jgi:hypothetical protein
VTKSLPSAAIARAHRDLISSSEDIAVGSLANGRTACHRGNCVELTTDGDLPEARFGWTGNVGGLVRTQIPTSRNGRQKWAPGWVGLPGDPDGFWKL